MTNNKPYTIGADVLVTDAFDPHGEKIESIVLAYDDETDMYTIEMYNGYVESVSSGKVFGWWDE